MQFAANVTTETVIMVLVPVEPLQKLIADNIQAKGRSPAENGRMAKSLVGSRITGHDSHGVLRMPPYV